MRGRIVRTLVLGFVAASGAGFVGASQLSPGAAPVAPDVFSIGYAGTALSYGPNGFRGGTFSTGTVSGQYLMEVDSDPGNVYCPNCIDLILQVYVASSSTANLASYTWSGFTGYLTDAGYDSLSVGDLTECGPGDNGWCQADVIPTSVSLDATGTVITFGFPTGGITPNDASVDMVVEVNASTYTDPGLSFFGTDGSKALNLQSFGPAGPVIPPVPEPASSILLGGAAIALAFAWRAGWFTGGAGKN